MRITTTMHKLRNGMATGIILMLIAYCVYIVPTAAIVNSISLVFVATGFLMTVAGFCLYSLCASQHVAVAKRERFKAVIVDADLFDTVPGPREVRR